MKNYPLSFIMAIISFLTACSTLPQPGDSMAYPVKVNGQTVIIKQLTESTWTVNSAARANMLTNTAPNVAALRQAVEATSGCKVTDSDFARQGQQFDAQVDCGNRLSN